MMNRLRKLISIAGLAGKMRHGGPAYLRGARGQVAILALLATGAVLIFALATANLGNMSATTIRTANAAEVAALELSSQLAMKSNQLHEALGGLERCRRTGLGAIVLAVVVAVVAIIVTWGMATPVVGTTFAAWVAANTTAVVAAGAIGGAIGGAAGGAIVQGSVTGAVHGAIQGAVIGAAIGLGVTTAAGAAGSWVPMGIGADVLTWVPSALGATVGGTTLAAGGAALSAASSIYTGAVQEQVTSKAFAAFARATRDLPDYERVREQAIFRVLSQVVDDPNRTSGTDPNRPSGTCHWDSPVVVRGDPLDSDGNGDTTESIPCFQHWWAQHLQNVKAAVAPPPQARPVGAVVDDFRRIGLWAAAETHAKEFVRWIDRKEVECSALAPVNAPPERNVDGPAVELWRALKLYNARNIPDSFWQQGPDRATLLDWYNAECVGAACESVPPGYDEVDGVHTEYDTVIDVARGIVNPRPREETLSPEEIERLREANVQDWRRFLYDANPASDGDFIEALPHVSAVIRGWIDTTTGVRDNLPLCRLAYGSHLSSSTVGASPLGPEYSNDNPIDDPNHPNNPIHQCTWAKVESQVDGTYVPNPICKIDEERKRELRRQIDIAADVDGYLRRGFANSNPCPAGWSLSPPALPGIEVGLTDNNLRYRFHVDYTCQTTVQERECNPDRPVPGERQNCRDVSRTVSVDYRADPSGTAQGFGAPDLTIPDGPIAGFLGAVASFRASLDGFSHTFATIDADVDDEFQPVLERLRREPDAIDGFVSALRGFQTELEDAQRNEAQDAADPERRNLTYQWTDSRGAHSVRVQIGPFRFAEIENEKRGNWFAGKKCLVLRNYSDEQRAWIKITREDPHATRTTRPFELWNWNSFFGGRITRCASGDYSFDHVGLHPRPNCP